MKKIVILLTAVACFISCENLKQAYSDIADLQGRVDSIEAQLKALQAAYDDGKIIKDVKPYEDDEHSGWTVTFSDNESIVIYDGIDGIDGEDGKDGENGKDGVDGIDGINGIDGKDGITPIVIINTEGYWEISYDNEETFSLILDNQGNPIMSKGEKGDNGQDGVDGENGKDGADGKEGVSVRIVVSEDGKYIIESYYESAPDTVIESIITPYASNPSSCITSIVKDPYNGVITLIMADGTEYAFNLDVTFPTSIVILAESLVLPKNGTSEFAFRVNPSNAVVDLNLTQEKPMFELDRAIANMTRSYVTESEFYTLNKIEPATDKDGNILNGQYIASITDLGLSDDYCEGAAIVINTKDGRGNEIQVSSEILKVKTPDKPQFTKFVIDNSYAADLENEFINIELPYGTDVTALRPDFVASEKHVSVAGEDIQPYTTLDFSSPVEFTVSDDNGKQESYIVSISYSRLPVVYINTKDAASITSKETWMKGTEIYVTNAGEYNQLYSDAQIRGRGNTTWNYPKKPYAIKLDSKSEVLGMPKHKRWVLLANYVDKTCIRNSVAFEIARRCEGLDYTPRGQHVDVVLNGVFLGNYFLCEQIKIDKNRVDITEMESTDIDAESITGGYLLEIDKNFDEVNKFYSPVRNMPVMIKEPDEETLTAEQLNYIQSHVTEIENALYGEGSTTEGYLQYIDLDSFIDYWLVYELTGTGEPTHPKSVYMYKDRGGKVHAGPVWDFDYFTFQPYYNNWLINMNAVWNDRIINDPATLPVIKERWNASREKYRTIAAEIDRQYESIKESAEYNATLWPLDLNVNRDDALSVEEAVARIKGYYETKFEYMDSYINTNF